MVNQTRAMVRDATEAFAIARVTMLDEAKIASRLRLQSPQQPKKRLEHSGGERDQGRHAAVSRLPFEAGTRIVAVRNFGPVEQGAPGIITGTVETTFLWWSRQVYACTFAGNVKVPAKPKDIDVLDHGYSLVDLENPQFGLNELLRMRMRRVRTE
jgi:hypothetical protein